MLRKKSLRESLDQVINESSGPLGAAYILVMTTLTLIVCVAFVAHTYTIGRSVHDFWWVFEQVISVIFLIDYIIRWWTYRFSFSYPFQPLAIVDLVSFIPLFLVDSHWQFVRILRMLRILRVLRFFQSRKALPWAIREYHLRLVRILFTVFCILFIASGLIHEVEHNSNKDINTFFDAFYFSVVTLTTVGYGDITPLSTPGRVVTVLMILSGVVLIPWQLTSLAHHLVQAGRKTRHTCKRCGLEQHELDANFCKICGQRLTVEQIK